jgi:hypothetical protein
MTRDIIRIAYILLVTALVIFVLIRVVRWVVGLF